MIKLKWYGYDIGRGRHIEICIHTFFGAKAMDAENDLYKAIDLHGKKTPQQAIEDLLEAVNLEGQAFAIHNAGLCEGPSEVCKALKRI